MNNMPDPFLTFAGIGLYTFSGGYGREIRTGIPPIGLVGISALAGLIVDG